MVEKKEKCIYFYGKAHPFSNFHPSPMIIGGQKYPTAQKFVGSPYEQTIREASTPAEAKKLGSSRLQKLRSGRQFSFQCLLQDWEEAKVSLMEKAVKEKFQQNPKLLEKLLESEDQKIVEKALGDYYWGCGKNQTGKNMLGQILMKVRTEFKKQLI